MHRRAHARRGLVVQTRKSEKIQVWEYNREPCRSWGEVHMGTICYQPGDPSTRDRGPA